MAGNKLNIKNYNKFKQLVISYDGSIEKLLSLDSKEIAKLAGIRTGWFYRMGRPAALLDEWKKSVIALSRKEYERRIYGNRIDKKANAVLKALTMDDYIFTYMMKRKDLDFLCELLEFFREDVQERYLNVVCLNVMLMFTNCCQGYGDKAYQRYKTIHPDYDETFDIFVNKIKKYGRDNDGDQQQAA